MKNKFLNQVLKWEAQAGGWQIQDQSGLHAETLSQKDEGNVNSSSQVPSDWIPKAPT